MPTNDQAFQKWLEERQESLRAKFLNESLKAKELENRWNKEIFINQSILSIPAVHLRHIDAVYFAKQIKLYFDAGYTIDDLLDQPDGNSLASKYWPAWQVLHEKLMELGWQERTDIHQFLKVRFS